MHIAQVSDFLYASNAAQFESLSDLIPPKLITTQLAEEDVATLRHRRMPMERLVRIIIGMAIFRRIPMTQLVNQLDILLPGNRPFVAHSAFLQARQKLGDKIIERLFHETASRWHQQTPRLGHSPSMVWCYPEQCRCLYQTWHAAWRDCLSASRHALPDGAHQPPACTSGHRELRRQRDSTGQATHRAHRTTRSPCSTRGSAPSTAPRMANNRQRTALGCCHSKRAPNKRWYASRRSECSGASQNQSTGEEEVPATGWHGGSVLADPPHQWQGAASADLDGRPDAFPGRRHCRAL